MIPKTNSSYTVRMFVKIESNYYSVIFFQASIWSMCEVGEGDSSAVVGTLPPIPNLHHVTGMLVVVENVHQGTLTLVQLTTQLDSEDPGEINSKLEKLSISNSQVALCCNELAASLLTVIKSAPCATDKELSSQVQSLSHEIARAGKNVNHLLKKRGVSSSSRKNSRTTQPQIMQSNVAAMKNAVTTLSTADNISKRGSLTVAQRGPDLEEKATAVSVGERGSRRKSSALRDVESRNNRTESISTVEHRSKADATPTASADTTNTECDIISNEKSSEPRQPTANSSSLNGSGSTAAEMTPVKTVPPPAEETVNVRHSNATGQVISESPTHSPPHHTTTSAAGNGFTGTNSVIASAPPPPTKIVTQTIADEEDYSVI